MSLNRNPGAVAISIPWLIVAGVCSPFGFNVVPALLPAIQGEFALDGARMQWMVSLYSLTLGMGQLIGGPLSDALGRRGVLLAGLAIFVAGSVAAVLAPTYEVLLAARLMQGLGACATLVIPRATVRDCFAGADAARAMALVMLSLAITPTVAPLIGGVLEVLLGWRSAFAACAVLGIAVLAAALRLHHESLPPARRAPLRLAPLLRGYAALLASWRFCAYALSFSLLNCCFMGFMVVGPSYLARTFGLASTGIALAMLAGYLGFTIGNVVAARRVRRAGVDRLLALGTVVVLAGTLVLFGAVHARSLGWLLAAVCAQSLGTGLAFSPGIAGATATLPERAGTASALTGAIQLGGGALFAMLSGVIDDGSFMPYAWSCLVACAAAALCVLPLWRGRDPLRSRAA
ncbi:MAG: MFS transporter [Burkholderiales bacterium]|nr:MFS transporter [Burkholderiales bacterium]